ncbi:putative reverse transcriptase domain-containing protein [Tanacetum coccineum]
MEKLARRYIDEVIASHRVPVCIIFDHDRRFALQFWQTLQKALGTRLDMSTAYHPQTDGQTEFSYNNSYHSSIRCAPFKALYRRQCKSLVLWAEIGESQLIRPELVQETTDKVVLIKERLKAVRDRQKSYANNRREPLEFEVEKENVDMLIDYIEKGPFQLKKEITVPGANGVADEKRAQMVADLSSCHTPLKAETQDATFRRHRIR